jgi:hypothetical protein
MTAKLRLLQGSLHCLEGNLQTFFDNEAITMNFINSGLTN